jgi:hypothetical protein
MHHRYEILFHPPSQADQGRGRRSHSVPTNITGMSPTLGVPPRINLSHIIVSKDSSHKLKLKAVFCDGNEALHYLAIHPNSDGYRGKKNNGHNFACFTFRQKEYGYYAKVRLIVRYITYQYNGSRVMCTMQCRLFQEIWHTIIPCQLVQCFQ